MGPAVAAAVAAAAAIRRRRATAAAAASAHLGKRRQGGKRNSRMQKVLAPHASLFRHVTVTVFIYYLDRSFPHSLHNEQK